MFGCTGSTDVTVDAIEWAVANDMDVINMSLGSPFGSADDPSAVASSNAAKAGVIVVASAGNNGGAPYITGSPASGSGAISVAASDPTRSFPGANLAFSTGSTLVAIDANGAALPTGTLPVVVLRSSPTTISLGCDPAEYVAAGVAGKLVVTRRGTCARVARAIFGEKAGAAAVVMLNNAPGFPPFEGPITSNPDDGQRFDVTIPFLGVPLTAAAALVNTADPGLVAGYSTRNAGAGLVQVQNAAATQVVAMATDDAPVLNFGFAELDRDLTAKSQIKLRNLGTTAATFDVAVTRASGSAHQLALRTSRVTVRPNADAEVAVELTVPAATAGDASAFSDVAGLVTFTPVGGSNGGVALRVPYYLVPVAVSHVATSIDLKALRTAGSATATVTNRRGAIAGNADWYAWGLAGKKDAALGSNDLRAVGVQTFPADGVLAFAIDTFKRWSNASMNEFDVFVDVNGDGSWDYDVVGADLGALTAGSFSGQMAVAVFPRAIPGVDPTPTGSIRLLADAPTDSTSVVLPVLFGQLCRTNHPCLSAASPRLGYFVQSFGLTDGTFDTIAEPASFNAFTPSVSTGMFDVVAPGATVTETVSIDAAEFARTPALGFMIVSHDNPSVKDESEAQLVDLR